MRTDGTNECNVSAPAFPVAGSMTGLTKREWFAGMALCGILAAYPSYKNPTGTALAYADELLAKLEATQ